MNSYDIEKRFISLNGTETTIAIERLYWSAIDVHARGKGAPWQELVKALLRKKPNEDISRAAWLRYIVTCALFAKIQALRQRSASEI